MHPTRFLLLLRSVTQLELEESVERAKASAPEQQQSAVRGLGLSAVAELDRSPPPPPPLSRRVCAHPCQ